MTATWGAIVSVALNAAGAVLTSAPIPPAVKAAVPGILEAAKAALYELLAPDVVLVGGSDGVPGKIEDFRD